MIKEKNEFNFFVCADKHQSFAQVQLCFTCYVWLWCLTSLAYKYISV